MSTGNFWGLLPTSKVLGKVITDPPDFSVLGAPAFFTFLSGIGPDYLYPLTPLVRGGQCAGDVTDEMVLGLGGFDVQH